MLAALMVLSLSATVFAAESVIATDSSWEISASSDLGNTIEKAFDGDDATYWHTNYTGEDGVVTSHDECPHTITVNFKKEMTVSGFKYTPRSDNGTGTFLEFNVYSSADGKTFKLIYEGSFDYEAGADIIRPAKSVSWGNLKMTAIKIEVTKSLGGYGTAAEINFLTGGTGTAIENGAAYSDGAAGGSNAAASEVSGAVIKKDAAWKISTSSDHGDTIEKAFDGDTATYWHTNYTGKDGVVTSHDECPHTITVNFGKETAVSGWLYTPRGDNGSGTALKYNIYKSADGQSFEKIYTGTFDYESIASKNKPKGASWGNTKMKAIKIEITDSLGGYGTAAEIAFYTGGTGTSNASSSTGSDNYDTVKGRTAADGTAFYAKTGWSATVNSEKGSNVQKIFDNDVATYWHTDYEADGPTVTSHDDPPYHLKITLPKAVTTSGIVLTPRTDNASGIINAADIYVSDTDDGEWFLLKHVEFKTNYIPQEVLLTANITVKRVWLEITASTAGYGTLAEFDLMVKKDELETVKFEDYAENEVKNALYEIDRSNFSVTTNYESWNTKIPINTIDGSEKTFWQTEEVLSFYDDPVTLTFDLKEIYKIKEIRYTPRQSDDCHGAWLRVSIYGSDDNENWFPVEERIEFEKNTNLKTITLSEEAEVRYLEFQIEDAFASRVSCAELTFWQSKAAMDEHEEANKEKYILKIGSPEIAAEKNGVTTTTEMDVTPEIVNGSTMIPLRGLLEQMGATVEWDGATETIRVDNGKNIIKLQIWNYHVYVYGTAYGDLRYTLLNPPIIKNSRTLIPVRFVSEQLGYNVSWDGATQTITIEK